MGYVGTYDRTIFYNPSNKYCIISVKTSDQSVPQQARSAYRHRDNMIRFIAVGYELPQTDKVSMILDGEWENGKHGVQLQVDKCEEIVPQTKEGVYGYLSSRLIKGVGEKTAALIVNRFGADALRVLENEPERGSRCTVCYRLRMRRAAQYAAEHGFEWFTTTLSISPHKDAKRINAIGQELEAEFGVKHLPSDFKKHNGYLRSLQLSEEYGLYRQDYCGCEFSAKARGIEK